MNLPTFPNRMNLFLLVAMLLWACTSDKTAESADGPADTGHDSGSDTDTDADTDTDSDTDTGMDSNGSWAYPPVVCAEPAAWETPTVRSVVGNGTADSCTGDALRSAVGTGAHVTFDCGANPVVIDVTDEIEVASGTVIDGDENDITLDGGGTNRILVVPSNGTLSVRNLRFINGKTNESEDADGIGGAVAGNWRSAVEVRHCIFENNSAGRGGGAVAVWTGSSLTVVGSEFRNNASYYGGAIYSLLSELNVVNSRFVGNDTIDNGWGEGGAIGTDGASEDPDDDIGGTIHICGCDIRENRGLHSGGGVYIWVYPPDEVTVDRTNVESNEIGAGGLGGGMRISNGLIQVTASSFISNVSDNHGGALYLDCAPECHIVNSTFFGNTAETYGGAISSGTAVNINNVTFAKNRAGGHGGALFGGDGFVLHNTVFVDNSAGNPWNQANNCGSTLTGDHVLQWRSESGDSGGDTCVPDVLVQDPRLSSPPADNGGPTHTLLPSDDSPVLQAGQDCAATDQRGESRATDHCDLGAVELP
jgi:predicted outer membrane repeat protein